MKHLPIIFLLTLPTLLHAQTFSFHLGTDIPYQFHTGLTLQTDRIDVSYRTGILITPYSDITLQIVQAFGTDEIYINMLESAYQFGWMNGIGGYYKIGPTRSWYIGPEFRFDILTANDTPKELIEAVAGEQITAQGTRTQRQIEAKLGLTLYALGFRTGKKITLDKANRHALQLEFSAYKHITTQSHLKINDRPRDALNEVVDQLLWNDVFKPYGFLGGLGVTYTYRFN